METNKKLELLTGIVDEFNLSVNDVVSYWVKSGRLNLDAATVSSQVVSSGKYETPKRVLPGMYIYADGLIYPEIIEGRQVMTVLTCWLFVFRRRVCHGPAIGWRQKQPRK